MDICAIIRPWLLQDEDRTGQAEEEWTSSPGKRISLWQAFGKALSKLGNLRILILTSLPLQYDGVLAVGKQLGRLPNLQCLSLRDAELLAGEPEGKQRTGIDALAATLCKAQQLQTLGLEKNDLRCSDLEPLVVPISSLVQRGCLKNLLLRENDMTLRSLDAGAWSDLEPGLFRGLIDVDSGGDSEVEEDILYDESDEYGSDGYEGYIDDSEDEDELHEMMNPWLAGEGVFEEGDDDSE